MFLPESDPWTRFRIGPAGSFASHTTYPGCQFPSDPESYRNFVRQIVPRFTTTDALTLKAYLALLDRVEPAVVMAHSQAGLFGCQAPMQRPDKVRAIVLVEPAATGELAHVAALKDVPVLMVYGDFIDRDSRWPAIRAAGLKFADALRAAGGSVDVIDLPQHGIHGNCHMMMMDRNNDVVAGVVQDWLAGKGLWG